MVLQARNGPTPQRQSAPAGPTIHTGRRAGQSREQPGPRSSLDAVVSSPQRFASLFDFADKMDATEAKSWQSDKKDTNKALLAGLPRGRPSGGGGPDMSKASEAKRRWDEATKRQAEQDKVATIAFPFYNAI